MEKSNKCTMVRHRDKICRAVFERDRYAGNLLNEARENLESIIDDICYTYNFYKAKAPVEFGAKLDMSIDENGFARLERLSFDAYNEADVLISAIERYRKRTGRYPERVLVDQIYRNRNNRAFCKSKGIRISGPALGRPKKEPTPEERKTAYSDNTDRIEVERGFSLAKRCCGLGFIRTKLDTTTRCSIALSLLVLNLEKLARGSLRRFLGFLYGVISMLLKPKNNLITVSCG